MTFSEGAGGGRRWWEARVRVRVVCAEMANVLRKC